MTIIRVLILSLILMASPVLAQTTPVPAGFLQVNTTSPTSNGTPLNLGGTMPVVTITAFVTSGTFQGSFTIQGGGPAATGTGPAQTGLTNLSCFSPQDVFRQTPLNQTGWLTTSGVWFCQTTGIYYIQATPTNNVPNGVYIHAAASPVGTIGVPLIPVTPTNPLTAQSIVASRNISTAGPVLAIPGDMTIPCTRQAVVPPGFLGLTLRARPGTLPATTKIVAIAGTSLTETTVTDNIPGGGC